MADDIQHVLYAHEFFPRLACLRAARNFCRIDLQPVLETCAAKAAARQHRQQDRGAGLEGKLAFVCMSVNR